MPHPSYISVSREQTETMNRISPLPPRRRTSRVKSLAGDDSVSSSAKSDYSQVGWSNAILMAKTIKIMEACDDVVDIYIRRFGRAASWVKVGRELVAQHSSYYSSALSSFSSIKNFLAY